METRKELKWCAIMRRCFTLSKILYTCQAWPQGTCASSGTWLWSHAVHCQRSCGIRHVYHKKPSINQSSTGEVYKSRLVYVPLFCSIVVNYFILTDLKNLLDWRQFLGVKTLPLHSQVACEQVVHDAQVHALLCDVLDGLRNKPIVHQKGFHLCLLHWTL